MAGGLGALGPEALVPRFGVSFMANGVPATASAAAPILGTLGLDLSLPFSPGSAFSLEPGVSCFSYYAALLDAQPDSGPALDLPRAVPSPAEFADSAWTGSALLSSPFVAKVRLGASVAPYAGLGPALLVRAAFGGTDAGAVTAWYFGAGRWLFAEARAGIELELLPGMALSLDARGYFPVANLWADPDPLMAFDGALLGIGASVRISTGGRRAATPGSESAPTVPPPAADATTTEASAP